MKCTMIQAYPIRLWHRVFALCHIGNAHQMCIRQIEWNFGNLCILSLMLPYHVIPSIDTASTLNFTFINCFLMLYSVWHFHYSHSFFGRLLCIKSPQTWSGFACLTNWTTAKRPIGCVSSVRSIQNSQKCGVCLQRLFKISHKFRVNAAGQRWNEDTKKKQHRQNSCLATDAWLGEQKKRTRQNRSTVGAQKSHDSFVPFCNREWARERFYFLRHNLLHTHVLHQRPVKYELCVVFFTLLLVANT